MLERARRKLRRRPGWKGDMLALPFEDGSFEAATVGFGVRNVADLEAGLAELRGCSSPAGAVAVLEITQPRGVLAPFYRVWFDRIVPCSASSEGRRGLHVPAGERAPVSGPDELAACCAHAGFAQSRTGTFAGGSSPCHDGEARVTERARRHPRDAGLDLYLEELEERLRRPSLARRRRRAASRDALTPAASGCGRCWFFSRRAGGRRRSPPGSRSSSCTWRRSSTTT
jgi:hypothetical protein